VKLIRYAQLWCPLTARSISVRLEAGLTAAAVAILLCTFLLADTANPPEIAWPGPIAIREEPPLLEREINPTEIAFARAFPGFLSESAADRAAESAMTPVATAFATESDTQSTQPVLAEDVATASP
jgi:hypothetical protein